MIELNYTSLIKMIILEENSKWHEAFASELFLYKLLLLFTTQIVSKQLYSDNRKIMQQSLFLLYSRSQGAVQN